MTTQTGKRAALCATCGLARTVSARLVRDQWLRCAGCSKQTLHAVIATDPGQEDPRERENRTVDPERLRLQQMLQFFDDMRIYVHWEKDVEGGEAEVTRYLQKVYFPGRGPRRECRLVVTVNPMLTARQKLSALRWAWERILPSDAWDTYPIHNDRRLGPSMGMYRTPRFPTR